MGAPWPLSFSPDGQVLAAGTVDGLVTLWHVADGRIHATLKPAGLVSALAFSPDGKTLATSGENDSVNGENRTVTLWHVATGEKLGTLTTKAVTSLEFTRDGRTLIAGRANTTVQLWRAASDDKPGSVSTTTVLNKPQLDFAR